MAEREAEVGGDVETRQVSFNFDVPPLTGIVLRAQCPLFGKITEVSYHFPPGTNQLVDMALRYGTVRISPVQGFIRLNNATPIYYINQPCSGDEELALIINNTDIVFPHEVSCVVTVIGRYKPLKIEEEK